MIEYTVKKSRYFDITTNTQRYKRRRTHPNPRETHMNASTHHANAEFSWPNGDSSRRISVQVTHRHLRISISLIKHLRKQCLEWSRLHRYAVLRSFEFTQLGYPDSQT
ncbi:uncharacterized protein ARMOST_20138 [Armillaria ostoyae]|uniref:Uncharacterized protein n=1 Tax=Armillaria ostoyae TaxID=47428 RepID=A0A284S6H0_ARMOS|nr:uncharacterized protein ARMOST_20138 [Armillaria ostoyae]